MSVHWATGGVKPRPYAEAFDGFETEGFIVSIAMDCDVVTLPK